MTVPTRIADFEFTILSLDRFRLDGGAMFGVIPKAMWERECSADDKNRIAMGCQSILLRRDNKVILIDAGLGNKWNSKSRSIYALEDASIGSGLFPELLAEHQLRPEDVTDVIVTHLHFDHVGGLTYLDDRGELACTFPQARHWVQAAHLDWARSPSEKDRGSFPSENIEPLVKNDLFSLVRGDQELFRGLQVYAFNGHTRSMQSVLLDGQEKVFFPADLLPMKPHLHLPYIMAYDIEPMTTLKEKKLVLERALKEDWLLLLEHEPVPTIGRVETFEGKYRLGIA